MRKLRFYGTSNANPHPDRRQSGLLLTIDDNHYLFDCGDGIATALWNDPNVCLNKIHAVFFSHRHADHLGGLASLVLLMHQRIKNSRIIQPGLGIERQIPPMNISNPELAIFIPGDEDQAEFFTELLDRMHTSDIETAYLKKVYPIHDHLDVYQDQYLKITCFPTFHSMDACGFIIQIGSTKILYSGDIKHPKIVAEVVGSEYFDIIIIENAHFTPKEINDTLRHLDIGTLLITHQRDEYLNNRNSVLEDLKELSKKTKLTLVDDGMEFNL
jgi:ribonuclease BN (tRNA processing enzyme)